MRTGGDGIRTGGDGVRTGGNGVRTGGNGVRTGGDGIRTGGNGVRTGGDGVCTSGDGVCTDDYVVRTGGCVPEERFVGRERVNDIRVPEERFVGFLLPTRRSAGTRVKCIFISTHETFLRNVDAINSFFVLPTRCSSGTRMKRIHDKGYKSRVIASEAKQPAH